MQIGRQFARLVCAVLCFASRPASADHLVDFALELIAEDTSPPRFACLIYETESKGRQIGVKLRYFREQNQIDRQELADSPIVGSTVHQRKAALKHIAKTISEPEATEQSRTCTTEYCRPELPDLVPADNLYVVCLENRSRTDNNRMVFLRIHTAALGDGAPSQSNSEIARAYYGGSTIALSLDQKLETGQPFLTADVVGGHYKSVVGAGAPVIRRAIVRVPIIPKCWQFSLGYSVSQLQPHAAEWISGSSTCSPTPSGTSNQALLVPSTSAPAALNLSIEGGSLVYEIDSSPTPGVTPQVKSLSFDYGLCGNESGCPEIALCEVQDEIHGRVCRYQCRFTAPQPLLGEPRDFYVTDKDTREAWRIKVRMPNEQINYFPKNGRRRLKIRSPDLRGAASSWATLVERPGDRITGIEFPDFQTRVTLSGTTALNFADLEVGCRPRLRYRLLGDRQFRTGSSQIENGGIRPRAAQTSSDQRGGVVVLAGGAIHASRRYRGVQLGRKILAPMLGAGLFYEAFGYDDSFGLATSLRLDLARVGSHTLSSRGRPAPGATQRFLLRPALGADFVFRGYVGSMRFSLGQEVGFGIYAIGDELDVRPWLWSYMPIVLGVAMRLGRVWLKLRTGLLLEQTPVYSSPGFIGPVETDTTMVIGVPVQIGAQFDEVF